MRRSLKAIVVFSSIMLGMMPGAGLTLPNPAQSSPIRIICFGDSITAGSSESERWTTLLQGRLDSTKPGCCQVVNRGIGGHTSAQGLDRIEQDVLALLPAVVLIEFGFNDCNTRPPFIVPRVGVEEYKKNLSELHRLVAKNGTPVFIINHPATREEMQGNGKTYRENTIPYDRALRSVAAELNAPAIDLPAMIESRKISLPEFLVPDGVHLSTAGNKAYAEMVLDGLMKLGILR